MSEPPGAALFCLEPEPAPQHWFTIVTPPLNLFSFFFFLLFHAARHAGETIAEVKETDKGPPDAPPAAGNSLLTILTVVGGILLAVNLALIYCYLRRRAAKHLFGKQSVEACHPNGRSLSFFQADRRRAPRPGPSRRSWRWRGRYPSSLLWLCPWRGSCSSSSTLSLSRVLSNAGVPGLAERRRTVGVKVYIWVVAGVWPSSSSCSSLLFGHPVGKRGAHN